MEITAVDGKLNRLSEALMVSAARNLFNLKDDWSPNSWRHDQKTNTVESSESKGITVSAYAEKEKDSPTLTVRELAMHDRKSGASQRKSITPINAMYIQMDAADLLGIQTPQDIPPVQDTDTDMSYEQFLKETTMTTIEQAAAFFATVDQTTELSIRHRLQSEGIDILTTEECAVKLSDNRILVSDDVNSDTDFKDIPTPVKLHIMQLVFIATEKP